MASDRVSPLQQILIQQGDGRDQIQEAYQAVGASFYRHPEQLGMVDEEMGLFVWRQTHTRDGFGGGGSNNNNNFRCCFGRHFTYNHIIYNIASASNDTTLRSSSKSKTMYTILTVITQLAGTLLAFIKNNPNSNPRAEVQMLLVYIAAISSVAGFFASSCGLWLLYKKPVAARNMEALGNASIVLAFLGMMGIFFV